MYKSRGELGMPSKLNSDYSAGITGFRMSSFWKHLMQCSSIHSGHLEVTEQHSLSPAPWGARAEGLGRNFLNEPSLIGGPILPTEDNHVSTEVLSLPTGSSCKLCPLPLQAYVKQYRYPCHTERLQFSFCHVDFVFSLPLAFYLHTHFTCVYGSSIIFHSSGYSNQL